MNMVQEARINKTNKHYSIQYHKYNYTKKKNNNKERKASRRYENYVVITDDKGKRYAFYNFHELIKYIDSFKMSFLPDGFSYTIHEE